MRCRLQSINVVFYAMDILTECKAIRASCLKDVGDESNNAEDAAWNDEINDIVERLAMKMNCKYHPIEWRVAAFVPNIINSHWNICAKFHNEKLIGPT